MPLISIKTNDRLLQRGNEEVVPADAILVHLVMWKVDATQTTIIDWAHRVRPLRIVKRRPQLPLTRQLSAALPTSAEARKGYALAPHKKVVPS